jgi:hypothetical protein
MSKLVAIQPFPVFGHLFELHLEEDADFSAFAAAITARRLASRALAAPVPYTREHAEAALLEIRVTLLNAYMTDASARDAQHVAVAEYLDEHPTASLSARFAEALARTSAPPDTATAPTAAMDAAIDQVIGRADSTEFRGQRRKPMRLRRTTRKQRNAQRRAAQL